MSKIYSRLNEIPQGQANDMIMDGCVVLEGGALRGLYTAGVLDELMLNDINMRDTIGISAGAINAVGYHEGMIGETARFILENRFDSRYLGFRALKNNKGIFGFDFIFEGMQSYGHSLFLNHDRHFITLATSLDNGSHVAFKDNECDDIFQAIRASASMPILSKKVIVNDQSYLDGGCYVSIPVEYALKQEYKKIIVVRTRDKNYRKSTNVGLTEIVEKILYHHYPKFLHNLMTSSQRYNSICDILDQLEKQGIIYVIAPSQEVTVKRTEKDLEKLGDLYELGRDDVKRQLDQIKAYLKAPA
ncbi:MAG: patatin family protein [Erysipelotrichaceae bacterium]|nr:patatin family protein [Erysipelotrichaceae bacterium]